jgi:protein associated with RNAse G/E
MQEGESISVHSYKQDGRLHRKWPARLVRFEGPLIVLEGFFSEEVVHPILGIIKAGTLSTEFFWTERWYSIFLFREPSGELRNFYCNINTPARLADGTLSFVDLDVDVLVRPDFSFQILDEEEFERHAELFNYPPVYRQRVQESIEELISLIEERQFPFSLNR